MHQFFAMVPPHGRGMCLILKCIIIHPTHIYVHVGCRKTIFVLVPHHMVGMICGCMCIVLKYHPYLHCIYK